MKLTTQWHYVGISIHTFIQIAHEIPKNGKNFVHVLRQRTTVFRFLRNSGYSTTFFGNSHTVFHEIQQTVVPDISQWLAPNKTPFLFLENKKTKN
jgi:arylsulfatase A-like enzyme